MAREELRERLLLHAKVWAGSSPRRCHAFSRLLTPRTCAPSFVTEYGRARVTPARERGGGAGRRSECGGGAEPWRCALVAIRSVCRPSRTVTPPAAHAPPYGITDRYIPLRLHAACCPGVSPTASTLHVTASRPTATVTPTPASRSRRMGSTASVTACPCRCRHRCQHRYRHRYQHRYRHRERSQ